MSSRRTYRPSIPSDYNTIPVGKGGTGARTFKQAAQNLGLLTRDLIGKPFGPIELDQQAKPATTMLPEGYRDISMPTLVGPAEVGPDGSVVLKITNYDAFVTYNVSVEGGTFRRDADKITFNANSTAIIGKVIINGVEFRIQIRIPVPVAPVIDSIVLTPETVGVKADFTTSLFYIEGIEDIHSATDWQLAEDASFTEIVSQIQASTSNLVSWSVPNLEPGTTYYVRARHHGTEYPGQYWSTTRSFVTNELGVVGGIAGPDSIVQRTQASFTILGYVEGRVYSVEFSENATGSRTGNTIYLDPVVNPGNVWIKVNSVRKDIAVTAYRPIVTSLQNVGPIAIEATRVVTIPDYVNYAVYDVSVSPGSSFTRQGAEITITASAITGTGWIEVNGYRTEFQITYPSPATPTIAVSSQETQVDKVKVELLSSVFSVPGFVGTHTGTTWELSDNANFTNAAEFLGSSLGLRDRSYPGLEPNTTYYARAKYQASTGMQSGWGMTSFQTSAWGAITGVSGASTIMAGSTVLYTIEGFQEGAPYRVTVSPGSSFTRNGAVVTFKAGTAGQSAWIEVNYFRKDLTLTYPVPAQPTVNAPSFSVQRVDLPTLGVTEDLINVGFTTSAFSVENNVGLHQASDWNISKSSNFTEIVASSVGSTDNKTSWVATNLEPQTQYYVRVRHHSSGGTMSDWSIRSFITPAWGQIDGLSGPISAEAGSTVTYTILGYQSSAPYRFEVSGGTIQRFGNEVYFTVPVSGTECWIKVNDVRVDLTLSYPAPSMPTISTPALETDGDSVNATFAATAFQIANGAGTHLNSDWELSSSSDFSVALKSSMNSTTNLTSWSVTDLEPGQTYYVRVRYRSSGNVASNWAVRPFTTTALGTVTGISGPDTVNTGSSTIYTIEGFQVGAPYTVEVSAGATYERSNASITFRAPSTQGSGWLRVNGITKSINVTKPVPMTPLIGEAALVIENDATTANLTTSAFSITDGSTHVSSDWYLARDANFTDVVWQSVNDPVRLTTAKIINLVPGTTYFLRVRHNSSSGTVSEFAVTSFVSIAYGPVTALVGPTSLVVETVDTYTINGYQPGLIYQVTSSSGLTVSRNGETITVTAGASPGTRWVKVNSITTYIEVVLPKPDTPSLSAPQTGSTGGLVNVGLVGSPFSAPDESLLHTMSTWEITRSSNFSYIDQSAVESSTALTAWNVYGLEPDTVYYARVRYRASNGNWSDWGTFSFRTMAMAVVTSLNGPTTMQENAAYEFTIPNYDSNKIYVVSVSGAGSGWSNGSSIFFEANTLPEGQTTGQATITVNGYNHVITITKAAIEP